MTSPLNTLPPNISLREICDLGKLFPLTEEIKNAVA